MATCGKDQPNTMDSSHNLRQRFGTVKAMIGCIFYVAITAERDLGASMVSALEQTPFSLRTWTAMLPTARMK